MALTQVRVKLRDAWTVLTYNQATGRYEGTLTAPGASNSQPGGYYSITAEATDSNGKTATISGTELTSLRLVVRDTIAPTLTVTTPSNNLVTAAASVTVSGMAADSSGISSVKVNGSAVAVAADGSFSTPVSLSAGNNSITVVATDAVGNTATVTRTVTQVTSGPALAIMSPAAGMVTNATSVTVTGTVSGSVSLVASVTVNGVAAKISGTSWSATVPLSEGSNTLSVVATNQVGLATTAARIVIRDNTVPVITITSPTAGQMTSQAVFAVTGTVSDNVEVASVTVNGTSAAVSGGTFSAAVTLAEGLNAITAAATDTAGNTASAFGTVLLDTTPPVLAVNYPAGYLITNQFALAVSGTVSDSGSGVESVTVNGTAATVSGGSWSLTVALSEGINTITAIASDRLGNETVVVRSILLDTVRPVLTLVSPAEGWIVNSQPTVLFGATDESSGLNMDTVGIWLDSVRQTSGVTVAEDSISFTPDSALPEGQHVITATVEDNAGNLRGLSAIYGVDTTPPELRLAAPDLHRVVDTEKIIVAGTVWDAQSGAESVTVKGTAAELESGAFSATVPLEVGVNLIRVAARDHAGLETAREIRVIRMVTDRTQADADRVAGLLARGAADWTAEELDWFLHSPCLRGSYGAADCNRVGEAVACLSEWLTAAGYLANTAPKTDWSNSEAPTDSQMETYLANIRILRPLMPVQTPAPPESMDDLTLQGANNIEAILVALDSVRPRIGLSDFYSSEIFCGEV